MGKMKQRVAELGLWTGKKDWSDELQNNEIAVEYYHQLFFSVT